jgi:2-octaprenylphenol hydroxylase
MNLEFNVLVIGGGIVGLTAALAMAQRGYTVAVIDAGSLTVDTSKPDLRVYAINQTSQTLLQQLDAWQHLDQQRVSPYGLLPHPTWVPLLKSQFSNKPY